MSGVPKSRKACRLKSTIYNRGRENQPDLAGDSSQTEQFSMVPMSVNLANISSKALHVYVCLVREAPRKSNTVWIGHRLIAEKTGLNRETVSAALKELAKLGHIATTGEEKHRASYILTSNRFKDEAQPGIVSSPRESAGFDGVVPKKTLEVPCGKGPVFRAPKGRTA